MKKILFGICLIVFGMYCMDMATVVRSIVLERIGFVIPVAGIIFAIGGLVENEKGR